MIQRIRNKILREIRKRYRMGVPCQAQTTFVEEGTNWFEPILAGPSTFVGDCSGSKAISGVIEISKKLSQDSWSRFNIEFYETGLKRFGEKWKYADLNTVLYGICKNIKVESYLEIGVRRGRSMCIVAAISPAAKIVGFDMWIKDYAGMENPGPDFVREELRKVGYKSKVDLESGDSRYTVPKYFKNNTDAYFDLITVDGNHTRRGARIDLMNVIPRLKIGGIIVFDDISNPHLPDLKAVWDKVIAKSGRFLTYSFDEVGYGVSFGIKLF